MGQLIYRQALQLLLPRECLFNYAYEAKQKADWMLNQQQSGGPKPSGKSRLGGIHATSLCVLYECFLSTCLTKNAVAKAGEEKQVGRHTETARYR